MQTELFSVLVVFLVVVGLIFWANKGLKDYEAGEKPKGIALYAMMYVESILSITVPVVGERRGKIMAGYIGSVFIYILLSNWSGLLGFNAPTSNYSVTLALALITWVTVQVVQVKENGVKGYISGFFDPFPFFVIPNLFGTVAPLISLSLRLFGNVLSGTIIMTLLYSFTGWVSGLIPVVGSFNFIGVFVAPWIHLYFDLFSGFLQAFLFISLTTIFIATELKEEEN